MRHASSVIFWQRECEFLAVSNTLQCCVRPFLLVSSEGSSRKFGLFFDNITGIVLSLNFSPSKRLFPLELVYRISGCSLSSLFALLFQVFMTSLWASSSVLYSTCMVCHVCWTDFCAVWFSCWTVLLWHEVFASLSFFGLCSGMNSELLFAIVMHISWLLCVLSDLGILSYQLYFVALAGRNPLLFCMAEDHNWEHCTWIKLLLLSGTVKDTTALLDVLGSWSRCTCSVSLSKDALHADVEWTLEIMWRAITTLRHFLNDQTKKYLRYFFVMCGFIRLPV